MAEFVENFTARQALGRAGHELVQTALADGAVAVARAVDLSVPDHGDGIGCGAVKSKSGSVSPAFLPNARIIWYARLRLTLKVWRYFREFLAVSGPGASSDAAFDFPSSRLPGAAASQDYKFTFPSSDNRPNAFQAAADELFVQLADFAGEADPPVPAARDVSQGLLEPVRAS